MELWVDEEYRDRMQSERVTAPLVGSPAGKLPPVPRDVRKAQRQAEKRKRKLPRLRPRLQEKGPSKNSIKFEFHCDCLISHTQSFQFQSYTLR